MQGKTTCPLGQRTARLDIAWLRTPSGWVSWVFPGFAIWAAVRTSAREDALRTGSAGCDRCRENDETAAGPARRFFLGPPLESLLAASLVCMLFTGRAHSSERCAHVRRAKKLAQGRSARRDCTIAQTRRPPAEPARANDVHALRTSGRGTRLRWLSLALAGVGSARTPGPTSSCTHALQQKARAQRTSKPSSPQIPLRRGERRRWCARVFLPSASSIRQRRPSFREDAPAPTPAPGGVLRWRTLRSCGPVGLFLMNFGGAGSSQRRE